MWHSVTRQMVTKMSNEHSTYSFKCQATKQEPTLCSSETYDTTQPKTPCHISEDLNPHLGSAYRIWWGMIYLPHFLFPSNIYSRNADAGLLVSDATDLGIVARSHKKHRSQMSHKSLCWKFPHFKYRITNIIFKFPPLFVSLLPRGWGGKKT
jgi:hypothetical protein